MREEDLTEGQRKWLQASREIGPGAMTRSERLRLEQLYRDLTPREQVRLQDYIQEHFGSKDEDDVDRIEEMARRVWLNPSDKLREKLARSQTLPRPTLYED